MQQLFLCKKIRIFDKFATARYFPCWSLHCSGSFAYRRSEKVGKIVELIQTSYVVQSSVITGTNLLQITTLKIVTIHHVRQIFVRSALLAKKYTDKA